ncbi:MAG: hypothetical protein UR54_C0003G0004 [Candidatus Roizmanbacteria bacterium GW2011_GWA2_34_18]|uniref:Uncharacterized protein n=1 Tax=Candidatus Roizmanbacteria bacterium GW2011_GWA2_34_18 TaxID=1618477 RepID=A0A0G0AVW6_9BACT|nr:MAG: hypothetical protein UR54_C0003G0004 [Candidatus Roizmanbacteria bacterium GW2011_GWA2_34_18]
MLSKSISESAKETTKWLKELNWKKILLVGLIYTVFTTVIRQLEVVLTMKYYQMSQYFGVWSKLMMPNAGPPPPSFMIMSLVFTLYSGISLAVVYYYIRNLLPKLFWKRVFFFADLMIAASFIFFTLPCYLLFNLPPQLLLSWFISGFIILVLTSLALVKIIN